MVFSCCQTEKSNLSKLSSKIKEPGAAGTPLAVVWPEYKQAKRLLCGNFEQQESKD